MDGWIYYVSMSNNTIWGDERIYKIKADGSGKKIQLSANRALYMNVTHDWIYFIQDSSENRGSGFIKKVRVDGTGEEYIDIKNGDYATDLNIVGDYIYYINRSDNSIIYRVKTDGTGREKVGSEAAWGLNVVNGYAYYVDGYYGKLKKIPVDGGTPEIIKTMYIIIL